MLELVAELKKLNILFPIWRAGSCGEQTEPLVNAAEKMKDVVRLIWFLKLSEHRL